MVPGAWALQAPALKPPYGRPTGASSPSGVGRDLRSLLTLGDFFPRGKKSPKSAPALRAGPPFCGESVLGWTQRSFHRNCSVWAYCPPSLRSTPRGVVEWFICEASSVLCGVERSRQQLDKVKTYSAANAKVAKGDWAPHRELRTTGLKEPLRPTTRDPARFRLGRPQDERKIKPQI